MMWRFEAGWGWPAGLVGMVLLLAGCSSGPALEVLGPYRFPDGRIVSIRSNDDGGILRYRMFDDGASQRLYPRGGRRYAAGEGFAGEPPSSLTVEFGPPLGDGAPFVVWQRGGPPDTAVRVGRERPVSFTSHGELFRGRVQIPEGDGPFPGVVLVHGSGSDAATETYYNGDFFVANGIATLTYDKRGTGESGGDFTFDFHRLAADAVAAAEVLRAQDEVDGGRVGLSGYSQGGWVAPLAACLDPTIAFAVVNYGMIESPSVEARLETRDLLESRGVTGAELEEADEVVAAAVNIVANEFKAGWEELEAARDKYRDRPWMDQFDGSPVHRILRYPKWLTRLVGRWFDLDGLSWTYDSYSLLQRLETPTFWILAEFDSSAPHDVTLPRLDSLDAAGTPHRYTVIEDADHGGFLFEDQDGARRYSGYAPDVFRLETDVVRELTAAGSPGRSRDCRPDEQPAAPPPLPLR